MKSGHAIVDDVAAAAADIESPCKLTLTTLKQKIDHKSKCRRTRKLSQQSMSKPRAMMTRSDHVKVDDADVDDLPTGRPKRAETMKWLLPTRLTKPQKTAKRSDHDAGGGDAGVAGHRKPSARTSQPLWRVTSISSTKLLPPWTWTKTRTTRKSGRDVHADAVDAVVPPNQKAESLRTP